MRSIPGPLAGLNTLKGEGTEASHPQIAADASRARPKADDPSADGAVLGGGIMCGDATKLLTLLFEGADPDHFVESRPIGKNGKAAPVFSPVAGLREVTERAMRSSADSDVYVGVLPRVRRKGGRADVGAARVIWADCDTPAAVEALREFALEPSMVVASGSGNNAHAYWLLEEPIDIELVEDLNRRIAAAIGSDAVVTDAGRVLRLPGTLNHKHDPPIEVRLTDCSATRYSLSQVEAGLPAIEALNPRSTKVRGADAGGGGGPTERVLARLENVRQTGSGWRATCPAHPDQRPSLSITEGQDGRCLLNCFAGCTADAVVAAIGLTTAALFDGGAGAPGTESVASALVGIAVSAGVELFHDASGATYARVPVRGHNEVWTIHSQRFKRWLRSELDRQQNRLAKAEAVNEAVELLSARADFHGPEREVHLRSAWTNDGFAYNLAEDAGRVVAASRNGWAISSDSEVAFLRRESVRPLPAPEPGGSIELLRPYVNVESEEDFRLIASWALMAIRPTGPFPLLVIQGQQGSAKSTTSRVLKELVDPVKAPIRSMPGSLQDLAIMAAGNSVIAIDNLSRMNDAMSDALCRLATGGGFSTRRLYTDDEEFIFEQKRAAILNGIDAVVRRQDLLGRSIVIRLPKIPKGARRDEATLWDDFERDRPKILGALLSAASAALTSWDATAVEGLRMADFARWAAAGAPSFGWTAAEFVTAYEDNLSGALTASLEGSLLATVVRRVVREGGSIEGEPADVFAELSGQLSEGEHRGRVFPKNAQAMSSALSRLAPALAEVGIDVILGTHGSGSGKTRWIALQGSDGRGDGTRGTQGSASEHPQSVRSEARPQASLGGPADQSRGDSR
jgi:RepB DNA-primase from phage plasmid